MTVTTLPAISTRIPKALLLLGISTITATPAIGNTLAGNASFGHGISGSQEAETRQSLSQRYSTKFSSELTSAMNAGGNLSYNKNWSERGGASESLTPNANFNIANDIFHASLSGMASNQVPAESPNSTSTAWQTSLGSAWNKKYWPSLQMNYGQGATTNDADPKTQDTTQSNLGVGASVDLPLASINYNFSQTDSNNIINNSESQNSNNTATIKTGRSFWNGKMSMNFSQKYSESVSEQIHHAAANTTVEDATQIAQTSASIPADVTFGALTPVTALTNNDLETVATTINPGDAINLGFKFSLNRQVNRIYLYTDPVTPPNASDANALRFSLYTSVDGSTSWDLITTNLAPTFDPSNNRIVLDIPDTDENYLKLVVTAWPATASISLTEMEAYYRYNTGNTGSTRKSRQISHLSNLGINAHLTDDIPLAYTMSFGKNYVGEHQTKDISQAATLKWNLHRYCQPSISISENKTQNDNSPVATGRTYSLNAISAPLPSIDLGFGLSQSNNFRGERSLNTNRNYTFSLAAVLYPDLTGSFGLNHSTSNNKQSGGLSSNWNYNATLTSRLSSKLTTNITASHSRSSSESPGSAGTSTATTDAAINFNIRPSDILSLRASASKSWGDGQEDAPLAHQISGTLALLRTHKTQLTTGFSYSKANLAAVKKIDAAWSWTISRFLAWRTNGSYTINEPRQWNINSQLSTKF